jgi:hypothetical protein
MIRYGLQWQALQDYLAIEETINSSVWGEGAAGTPPDNHVFIYAKDKSGTSGLFWKNDAGTEFDFSTMVGGSGASGRATFWTGTQTVSSDASFRWDNTNKFLGIGNSAPTKAIDVAGGTDDLTDINIRRASADASSGGLTMLKARGSIGSEAATQADDPLGIIGFGGFTTAAAFNKAAIRGWAKTLWTGSNSDTYLTIELTPTSSTTRAERARLTSDGTLRLGGGGAGIGSTTPGIEAMVPTGSSGGCTSYMVGVGTGVFGNWQGRSARGTVGSFSASQADDVLARFSGIGRGATDWSGTLRAGMDFVAGENWSDTAQGAYIVFKTTALLAASNAERFRIGPSGQWGIGGATYGTANNIFKSGGSSAAPSWGTINLLDSASIGDTLTGTVVRGDIIIGNSTPKWARLARGSSGAFLRNDGSDVQWSTLILPNSATANRIAYATSSNNYGESADLAFDGTDFLLGSGIRARMASQNRFRYLNSAAHVYSTTAQNTNTTGTFVTRNFPLESFDTDSIHDTVTNNSRLTCKLAGKYFVYGTISMSGASVTSPSNAGVRILKNGGTTDTYGTYIPYVGAAVDVIVTTGTMIDLAVNDYVELQAVFFGGGGTFDLTTGSSGPRFGMFYIGE